MSEIHSIELVRIPYGRGNLLFGMFLGGEVVGGYDLSVGPNTMDLG